MYEPPVEAAAQGVACCDVVNRGAAYSDGKIFYNTLDNQTVAVDAETGEEVWRIKVGDINKGESMTMAPIVVKGKVLVGNSGGEFGVRGWLTALDAGSGSIAWRAYSTVDDPDLEERLALEKSWAFSSGFTGWFMEVSHTAIGKRYIVTAMLLFLLGGIEALLMRIQLARPENGFLDPDVYNEIFTTHGLVGALLLYGAGPLRHRALRLVLAPRGPGTLRAQGEAVMRERPTLDVSDLPSVAFGARASIWWGAVGIMAIEGTMFAIMAASYFYLRGNAAEWPPTGAFHPGLALTTVNLAILLGSMTPTH